MRVQEDKGSTEERSDSSIIAGPTVGGEYQGNREISQESNSKQGGSRQSGILASVNSEEIVKKR